MIETFFYLILTLIIIFFLGFGITQITLPKRLLPYSFWLSPWVFIIFIILSLVQLSLLGVPVKISGPFIAIALFLLSGYLIYKNKPKIQITKKSVIIATVIILSIIFNIIPILRREGMLTTISMGNNDVIAYAMTADYLVKHSISESFYTKVHLAVDNLLHDGYRWGTPIISSFFLSIFNLQGYQYSYLLQAILFALMIPLVYVFLELIYKKISEFELTLLVAMTSLNSNLLYMLYHNFFGQVLFWGFEMIFLIFFFSYFNSQSENTNSINKYDILIISLTGVLYFSYHEGAIFIFGPLFIYLIWRLLSKTKPLNYLKKLFLIGFGSLVIGSISIFNAIIFDFGQTFAAKKGQPIGWELFRQQIPFANPFEALGFYNIHIFEPLPIIVALLISFLVLIIITAGIFKVRQKSLILCFAFIFLFFFYWTGIHHNNFFAYNRALTYTLPFFITLFVIGFLEILKNKKLLKNFLIIILCGLVLFSALKLSKKFRIIYVTVDKSFISLKEAPLNEINEPIYTESFIDISIPYWVQNWTGYFIYNNNFKHWPTKFVKGDNVNKVPDNSLVLNGKYSRWYYPPKRILKDIIWENEYFRIGRLCFSDECLVESNVDLTKIKVGENEFEDNLLLSGWSTKEGDFRWSNSLESTARLITRSDFNHSSLKIEARTLSEPQTLQLYIDDIYISEYKIKTDWKVYEFNLPYSLQPGVHHISLKYSNIYIPVKLGLSLDNRELSVAIKSISLN